MGEQTTTETTQATSTTEDLLKQIGEISAADNAGDNEDGKGGEDVPPSEDNHDGDGVGNEDGKGGKDGDKNHEEPATYTPDDEIIERAVRAGMTISDAKAFTSKESAERIISLLEEKSSSGETREEENQPDGDDLSSIEAEYTEENGYEPGVVNAMQTLVKEVRSLKQARNSAEQTDFFGSQFAALDEKVRSHVDAVRKSQLKSKFDVLEAGYKDTKANVKREDVFKEAVNLAIGDLVRKAEEEGKNLKAQQRRNLAVARPGGEGGRKKETQESKEAEILQSLREKFKLS